MAVIFTGHVSAAAPDPLSRDAVGDLNAPSIRAGDFPGAIKLPGDEGISLAIDGFVKTVAIADSDAEKRARIFYLPRLVRAVTIPLVDFRLIPP